MRPGPCSRPRCRWKVAIRGRRMVRSCRGGVGRDPGGGHSFWEASSPRGEKARWAAYLALRPVRTCTWRRRPNCKSSGSFIASRLVRRASTSRGGVSNEFAVRVVCATLCVWRVRGVAGGVWGRHLGCSRGPRRWGGAGSDYDNSLFGFCGEATPRDARFSAP